MAVSAIALRLPLKGALRKPLALSATVSAADPRPRLIRPRYINATLTSITSIMERTDRSRRSANEPDFSYGKAGHSDLVLSRVGIFLLGR